MKMGASLSYFFDASSEKLMIEPSGLLNRIFTSSFSAIMKKKPRLFMRLYSIIGMYTYKLPDKNNIKLVSTSHVPIPKGEKIVVYVHTPSRLLTIEYKEALELRRNGPFSILYMTIWRSIYFFLYRRSLRRAMIIISNSQNTRNRLLKYIGVDSMVILPTVDVDKFSNKGYGDFFFYPSRISSAKRQLYALSAFKEFVKQKDGFKLILATTNLKSKENIQYLNIVKKFIKENRLPVEIIEGADFDKIADLYSRAYTCLFAGKDEDFGLVPLESMASSKPIIAVNEGGMPETILDGVNGFLVNSEPEMTNRMIQLANDINMTKEMGESGRKYVKEKFIDEVFINRLKEIIESQVK